jgi:hypothetical protein
VTFTAMTLHGHGLKEKTAFPAELYWQKKGFICGKFKAFLPAEAAHKKPLSS